MSLNRDCKTCVFFVPAKGHTEEDKGKDKSHGTCRYNPPVGMSGGFPFTKEGMWCGKFDDGSVKEGQSTFWGGK